MCEVQLGVQLGVPLAIPLEDRLEDQLEDQLEVLAVVPVHDRDSGDTPKALISLTSPPLPTFPPIVGAVVVIYLKPQHPRHLVGSPIVQEALRLRGEPPPRALIFGVEARIPRDDIENLRIESLAEHVPLERRGRGLYTHIKNQLAHVESLDREQSRPLEDPRAEILETLVTRPLWTLRDPYRRRRGLLS